MLPPNSSETTKDKHIRKIEAELSLARIIIEGYERELGAPLRKVAEDVEKEWQPKVDEWKRKEAEARQFGNEVSVKYEKEKDVSQPVLAP